MKLQCKVCHEQPIVELVRDPNHSEDMVCCPNCDKQLAYATGYVPCICPDCGGTGIVIDYVAGCCRNPNEDGSCCNCPIPEPVKVQCCRCEATGYLRSEHGT